MGEQGETIRDRLDRFIEAAGTNRAHFERRCGLSNGYIRNMNDNMSARTLMQVCKAYADLNPMWLISGEGPMRRDDARTVDDLREVVRRQGEVIEMLTKLLDDAKL
ncbi:MAG: hypothetical protein MJZ81_06525 [Bacteroidales bacterium]|nr:hypothetical protein [Bacteroidales bacterium]